MHKSSKDKIGILVSRCKFGDMLRFVSKEILGNNDVIGLYSPDDSMHSSYSLPETITVPTVLEKPKVDYKNLELDGFSIKTFDQASVINYIMDRTIEHYSSIEIKHNAVYAVVKNEKSALKLKLAISEPFVK